MGNPRLDPATDPADGGASDLRMQVAEVSRRLAADGLVLGTAGNVSARRDEIVAITPTGADLGDLDAGDICLIGLDGVVVEGRLRPTSELELHLGIYRERADVGAVVHTHSLAASALSTVLSELPVLHYQQLLLGGELRVAPFHPFGSPELADAVHAALEGRQAALMANHGVVATGADLADAHAHAVLVEWLCELTCRARAVGTPQALDAAQQSAVVEAALRSGYGRTHER